MVFVTLTSQFVMSAPCYVTSASHYQSISSMYIRGLIPRNWQKQILYSDFIRGEMINASVCLLVPKCLLMINRIMTDP